MTMPLQRLSSTLPLVTEVVGVCLRFPNDDRRHDIFFSVIDEGEADETRGFLQLGQVLMLCEVDRLRHTSASTVWRIRKRFVADGLHGALHEVVRPGGQRTLDGEQEAYLVALACSTPPDGRKDWTMQRLADRLVTLGITETISDETVRRTLKRGASSRGNTSSGAFPR
jgi:transposase